MSQAALDQLQQAFPEAVLRTHAFRGDETAVVERGQIAAICTWLRDHAELRFNMLSDMTAVDRLTAVDRDPDDARFEVIYHLYSTSTHKRLRLKVPVPDDEPELDTASEVWPIANWLEREIWDMYGIRFMGHPELRRILLYEEFVGHPLRKDYPKAKRQPLVRRPENEIAEATDLSGPARALPEPYTGAEREGQR
jgi:NADH-quinone oxidoreductase subunit C